MTETDKEFITQVANKFGYPTEIVTELVESLRKTLVSDITLRNSRYFEMMNILTEPNNSIESIIINTAIGTVELSAPDPYFEMFINPIERVARKYLKDTGENNNPLHGQKLLAFDMVRRFVIDRTFTRFIGKISPHDNLIRMQTELKRHDTALIPYRQHLAIGWFVLHFELWAKPDHVLMTPKQWEVNETKDIDHNHYLASRIKTRLK